MARQSEHAGDLDLWSSHGRAITSHQATRAASLSADQRQENRVLAQTRQGIEQSVFRVLGGVYRHRRRRFALRVQLIAALCNLPRARPI
ncbi:hypothetical protein [Deinococcus sp. QL22]|uniref:hypothetical protein n=1 Tax=Deinococcus sp. QL22 TaxID=2939437 RepID=UPI00201816C4|nr:hypothetical protein [Deinococcus sp. QL22]UQN09654.1 hypothetical protein M1R55_26270 [Deinococcus sp. QL22]